MSRTVSAEREDDGRDGAERGEGSAAAWTKAATTRMAPDAVKRGAAERMAATIQAPAGEGFETEFEPLPSFGP